MDLLVRCCCQPMKVLGVMRGVRDDRYNRDVVILAERHRWLATRFIDEETEMARPLNVIRLPIRDWVCYTSQAAFDDGLDSHRRERAISSEETPVKVLKNCSNFREIIWMRVVC